MLKMVSQKQAVKQIVQVLVHAQPPRADEVVLKSGRKKKPAKKKAPRAKAPKAPKPPQPPSGPKPPDGFLSQVFGPPKPPQPFIQPLVPQSYFPPMQKTLEQQIADAIKKAQSPPAAAPSAVVPVPPAPPVIQPQRGYSIGAVGESVSSVFTNPMIRQPSISLNQAVSRRPTGEETAAAIMQRARAPLLAQAPLLGEAVLEQRALVLPRVVMPQSAPNASVQPSVDVTGDGNESRTLQPTSASFRLSPSPANVSPYQLPTSSNSSSSVFGDIPTRMELTSSLDAALRESGAKYIAEEQQRAGEVVDFVSEEDIGFPDRQAATVFSPLPPQIIAPRAAQASSSIEEDIEVEPPRPKRASRKKKQPE